MQSLILPIMLFQRLQLIIYFWRSERSKQVTLTKNFINTFKTVWILWYKNNKRRFSEVNAKAKRSLELIYKVRNEQVTKKGQTWQRFCAAGAPKIERTLASQQGREASCSRRRKKTTQAMPDDTHAKNKCSEFSLKSFARLLPLPMICSCLILGLWIWYLWFVS